VGILDSPCVLVAIATQSHLQKLLGRRVVDRISNPIAMVALGSRVRSHSGVEPWW
jgi:hypothetical protein